MAKTKSKSNDMLAQLRTVAFAVTVGSAMAYGLLAAFFAMSGNSTTDWVDNLSSILLEVMVIGGICMGLLYAYYKFSKKK